MAVNKSAIKNRKSMRAREHIEPWVSGPIASIVSQSVDNEFTIDDYIGVELHWESLKSRSWFER